VSDPAAQPVTLPDDPAAALAERLVTLSSQMLVAIEHGDVDGLAALLAEHQAVRSELEPLTAEARSAYDRLRAAGDPRAEEAARRLDRLRDPLERSHRANRLLEESAADACAGLEAQLATHRQRSAAVLAYGAAEAPSGESFSRVG
jgi:hypothetical protein